MSFSCFYQRAFSWERTCVDLYLPLQRDSIISLRRFRMVNSFSSSCSVENFNLKRFSNNWWSRRRRFNRSIDEHLIIGDNERFLRLTIFVDFDLSWQNGRIGHENDSAWYRCLVSRSSSIDESFGDGRDQFDREIEWRLRWFCCSERIGGGGVGG